ncbi:FAD dependent oxidoreductase [Xylariaceae sp. FL0804]|nr:FAD dependent oxidoreductase [Xylariaceae sp. FL0804]
MGSPNADSLVVLGAGVIGLSTALTLRDAYTHARIVVVAEHLPGDYHVDFTSPWAGGNWCSSATDNGILESFDRTTFEKFDHLATAFPKCGIERSPLRMIFDQKIQDAGILSKDTNKVWYESLVGGLDRVPEDEVPSCAVFGLDLRSTFVINTQVYLRWLLGRCLATDIRFVRRRISHVLDASEAVENCSVIFNCTGLGSHTLGGVEDKAMYPTRGQTVLVEQPLVPLERMYFRSPSRVDNDTTYVFQRPMAGGVVLGGCREDGNWNGEADPEMAKQIIERCCKLAPELGKPEDVRVIRHGVGLRPSRAGGPRIEADYGHGRVLVVHNYGASGAGYQASWGMAQHAVKLLRDARERFSLRANM